jgi:hypothetical protein
VTSPPLLLVPVHARSVHATPCAVHLQSLQPSGALNVAPTVVVFPPYVQVAPSPVADPSGFVFGR